MADVRPAATDAEMLLLMVRLQADRSRKPSRRCGRVRAPVVDSVWVWVHAEERAFGRCNPALGWPLFVAFFFFFFFFVVGLAVGSVVLFVDDVRICAEVPGCWT